MNKTEIYQSPDGQILDVQMDQQTVWLTQAQMVLLFERNQSVISRHIRNVFEEGELEEKSNMQILHIANSDKPVTYYNLDVIISVGYRVKSKRGTQFRQWATARLKEYLVKGYASPPPQYPTLPMTYKEALLQLVERVAQNEQLEAQVKALAPKAEYADRVLISQSEWTTTTIAKELGLTAHRLNIILYEQEVHYLNSDNVWVLYAKYANRGYTKTRTYLHEGVHIRTNIHTVWTEKGREFIHTLFYKLSIRKYK